MQVRGGKAREAEEDNYEEDYSDEPGGSSSNPTIC